MLTTLGIDSCDSINLKRIAFGLEGCGYGPVTITDDTMHVKVCREAGELTFALKLVGDKLMGLPPATRDFSSYEKPLNFVLKGVLAVITRCYMQFGGYDYLDERSVLKVDAPGYSYEVTKLWMVGKAAEPQAVMLLELLYCDKPVWWATALSDYDVEYYADIYKDMADVIDDYVKHGSPTDYLKGIVPKILATLRED